MLFRTSNIMEIFCTFIQVQKLKELSKLPDIYERLTRSLAPSIWELEDIKKGLLCQVPSRLTRNVLLITSPRIV